MARAVRFPAPPPPLEPDENLLPRKLAAERLGISEDTLKRMARRGEIASVKLGKLRRFEPKAIRAYIAAHRQSRTG
jgi:excisionase family DNA binding protein